MVQKRRMSVEELLTQVVRRKGALQSSFARWELAPVTIPYNILRNHMTSLVLAI